MEYNIKVSENNLDSECEKSNTITPDTLETAPPQSTRKKKRNTTGSPPNHLHIDNNNCKYYPTFIYISHTHTHTQATLKDNNFNQVYSNSFSHPQNAPRYKKAQGTNASDTYNPKKPNHLKINRKNTTEDLHPDDTRHPSNGVPATTTTK